MNTDDLFALFNQRTQNQTKKQAAAAVVPQTISLSDDDDDFELMLSRIKSEDSSQQAVAAAAAAASYFANQQQQDQWTSGVVSAAVSSSIELQPSVLSSTGAVQTFDELDLDFSSFDKDISEYLLSYMKNEERQQQQQQQQQQQAPFAVSTPLVRPSAEPLLSSTFEFQSSLPGLPSTSLHTQTLSNGYLDQDFNMFLGETLRQDPSSTIPQSSYSYLPYQHHQQDLYAGSAAAAAPVSIPASAPSYQPAQVPSYQPNYYYGAQQQQPGMSSHDPISASLYGTVRSVNMQNLQTLQPYWFGNEQQTGSFASDDTMTFMPTTTSFDVSIVTAAGTAGDDTMVEEEATGALMDLGDRDFEVQLRTRWPSLLKITITRVIAKRQEIKRIAAVIHQQYLNNMNQVLMVHKEVVAQKHTWSPERKLTFLVREEARLRSFADALLLRTQQACDEAIISFVEKNLKIKRTKLEPSAVAILTEWWDSHTNKYPTDDEKRELAKEAGIGKAQVTVWFTNMRSRRWKEKGSVSQSDDESSSC